MLKINLGSQIPVFFTGNKRAESLPKNNLTYSPPVDTYERAYMQEVIMPRIKKLKDPIVSPELLNKYIKAEDINISEERLNELIDDKTGELFIAAFNPGAIEDGKGGAHLLVRAVTGKNYPELPFESRLVYMHYKNGKVDPSSIKVVVEPDEDFPCGFEDPRITKFDDKFYMVCTGYDGKYPKMCLWSADKLEDKDSYKFEGVIGSKYLISAEQLGRNEDKMYDDKDAFFHPKKINGEYILYHRIGEDIQAVKVKSIEQLKDQNFWDEQISDLSSNTVMTAKPGTWENKLGGGPPPFRTKDGWLMIYHSSDKSGNGRTYRGGIALLDLKDPTKVISRSPFPVMEPDTEFERKGTVDAVVFPQGIVKKNKDTIQIFYGAADKYIGVAEAKTQDLLKFVKKFDENGNFK